MLKTMWLWSAMLLLMKTIGSCYVTKVSIWYKQGFQNGWGQDWLPWNWVIQSVWYERLRLGNSRSYILLEDSALAFVFSHLIIASKFRMGRLLHILFEVPMLLMNWQPMWLELFTKVLTLISLLTYIKSSELGHILVMYIVELQYGTLYKHV
jgi:hypothetical protein